MEVLASEPDLLDEQKARILVMWGRQQAELQSRLAETYERLLGARALLFPEGPPILQVKYLFTLARLASSLGRYDESYRHYQALAERATEVDFPSWAFQGKSSSLIQLRNRLEGTDDPAHRREAIDLAWEVLDEAREKKDTDWEVVTLITLVDLLRDERALDLARQCVELAPPESPEYWRYCRFKLAERLAPNEPQAAQQLIEETLAIPPPSDDLKDYASDLLVQLRVLWAGRFFEEALETTWKTLAYMEDLRDTQPDVAGRQGIFAGWASTYPWIAGRLRERYEETGDPVWLRHAFHVTERMRARTLLDILDTTQVTEQESPELLELRARRGEVLQDISRQQRRLREPRLSRGERRATLERIDQLENRQRLLKARIARHNERFRNLEDPDFASLEEVQARLRPDQALLSFQIAPWEGIFEAVPGGSWVTVVTTGGVRLHRLEVGGDLTDRVTQLIQLLEQRRPEGPAAARLHELLLRDALAALPEDVDELLLVLDGPLHPLPFAALRPTPDGEPLARRYRLVRVPSATLWLRWREEPLAPGPASALVLADPEVVEGGQAGPAATTRDAAPLMAETPLQDGVLGSLPWARQEGWTVRRFLGPGTRLLTGPQASEGFIKTASLTDYRLLHLAAHAVVTEGNPESFNVQLAPGSRGEDGFLQFREITELDLQGLTVVLSTCHSATGAVLRGEGVLDLARAFFQGGARAVVGSLWRLEDRATARFFADFHRHLARGVSTSEALHRSQVDQIRAGHPASAWAGIVMVGDGAARPLPEPRDRIPSEGLLVAALLCLIGAAAFHAWRGRRGSLPDKKSRPGEAGFPPTGLEG